MAVMMNVIGDTCAGGAGAAVLLAVFGGLARSSAAPHS